MTDDGGLAAMRTRLATLRRAAEIAGADRQPRRGEPARRRPRPAGGRARGLPVREEPHGRGDPRHRLALPGARTPGSQYVVIVGGDDAMPFFRYPDTAGLGPESDYVPPVLDTSASQASLRLRLHPLARTPTARRPRCSSRARRCRCPTSPSAASSETPTEIPASSTRTRPAPRPASCRRPTSSLVTGLRLPRRRRARGAQRSSSPAWARAPTNDQLITNQGVPPSTTGDAADGILDRRPAAHASCSGRRHDLIFLAGHFSANNALAADYTSTMNATELAASNVNLANSIVFSAGCHAGYTIVNDDGVPGVTQTLDWVAGLRPRRATLIAGTGYQYGDTDFLEYSERLYTGFAHGAARRAPARSPSATALVAAKQAYLEGTPEMRGIHAKALLEATLYGLPMLSVNLPAGRTPAARRALDRDVDEPGRHGPGQRARACAPPTSRSRRR